MARKSPSSSKRPNTHHLFALLVGLGLLVGSTILSSLDRPDADAQINWADRDYSRREPIVIESDQVSGNTDLTDFPVYVDLSDLSSTFWSTVQSDGGDILVSDSSQETLDHYLVSIDGTTDTGQLWFRAPTLGATSDTTFYIYYGNESADNTNDSSTWDSNYSAVFPLDDNLSSSSTVIDVTSNNNDATGTNVNGDNVATGKLGSAHASDGVDSRVDLSSISGTLGTLSYWVKFDAEVNNSSACDGTGLFFSQSNGSSYNYTAFGSCSGVMSGEVATMVRETGNDRVYSTGHTISSGWRHIAWAWAGNNTYQLYVDGVAQSMAKANGGIPQFSNVGFYLGRNTENGTFISDTFDHVSYSSIARSADWVKTEFNNQNNTAAFYTVGSSTQESSVGAGANKPSFAGPSGADAQVVPQLSSSSYSGTGSHQFSSWRISTSNSCTSNVIWENINTNTGLEAITVGGYEGTFLGSHAGKMALKFNTQYYGCVRHDDSLWSDPVSFTTEDLGDWSGSKTISVVNSTADDLVDYQTAIHVSSSDHSFGLNESDCSDIRFSDSEGVDALPHFTAYCDESSGKSTYWVVVPSIEGNSTSQIKMHYGNASANGFSAQIGNSVFNYYMDENDYADWTNGFNGDAGYTTFAPSGEYLQIAESEGGVHRAGLKLPTNVASMSSYTVENRFYASDSSGADDFFIITHEDLDYSPRHMQSRTPNYNNNTRFGFYDTANRVLAGFSFNTVFEGTAKINDATTQVSYYWKDEEGTQVAVSENRALATNSGKNTGPVYLHVGSGGSQNVNYFLDWLAIREHSTAEPGIGFGAYTVNAASAFDDDFNQKLDKVTLDFSRDIDAATVATSDFSLSTGHTISSVSVSGSTVTLTLTEAGSNDYNAANITVTIAGAVNSTLGESISSGTFDVLNTNTSCPFIDGSSSDGDASVNGAFTLSSDYTFINNYVDQLIDCDLSLTIDGATLTMQGNTSTGSIPHLQVNNLTVMDDAAITSYALGCVRTTDNGSGPNESNVCVTDGQGSSVGGSNQNNKGGGGAYGGDGGTSAQGRAGGTSFGSEASPVFFGASGANGYQASTGNGGGVIRITVDGALTVNGTIDSDGSHGVNVYRGGDGGGSGGSVFISTDSVAASSGVIRARGGGNNGSFGSSGGGGGCGGGGRVALFYNTIDAGTYSTWNSAGAATYAATGCTGGRAGANGSFYLGQAVTPPTTPSLSSPSNGASDVSRAPVLTASTYSDDTSADHTYTDWEIASDSEFSDIVWSSLDDADDLESITVNASKGTFAGSLSGATQLGSGTWYVRVRYANSAGESSNSSTSSFDTANTAPVVSNLSASQKTDGTGVVDLSFDVDDADDDQQLRVKVELDTGSGFADLELDETDGNTTASSGDPKVENDNAYQIGNSSGWVNTQPGILSLNTDLAASNFSGLSKEVTVRITANDGTSDSSAQTLAFTVDRVAPTEASSFTTTNLTSSSVSLSWDQSSDENFSRYHIQYGQTEANVEALSSGGVWDTDDDGDLTTVGTTSTTITGLTSETTYYAVVCAHDSYGNKTCTSDAIEFFITSSPSLSNYSAAQNQLDQVAVSFRANDPDGESLNVSVEYSIDGGSTWEDPTLSYAGSLNNSESYQLRSISTSGGAADVSFIWNAAVDVPSSTSISNARLRLRASDGSNNSAYLGSGTNFILDLVSPTSPGSFAASNPTSASVRLDWAATTEDNFQDYKITYGTSSGNLNNTWDTDDVANLGTRTTTSTTVTSLSQESTYFFKICAYDVYGHSSCSGEVSKATGSVPSVSSIVPAQKTDGTDHVDVSLIFDDADDNDLRAKVEISLDGGDTWTAAALRTGDAYTSASTDDPGVNNLSSYQLGITGAYISTSAGENTVSFDLSASNFSDTDIKEAYLRITPNDLGADGVRVTSGPYIVDTVDPSAPANLAQEARVADIMTLRWDPVTESNFNYYEVWYGKDATKVGNKNQASPNAALKFDHITGDTNMSQVENTTITLTDLEDGATYSVMVCAYDDFGNSACSDVSSFVKNKAPNAGRISLGRPDRSTGRVKVCTRVYDSDNPSQMQLGADYSINDGSTWVKMNIHSEGISSSIGDAPGLNNSAAYQLGTAGNYIDMSTGENKLCFLWNYREDIGSVKKNVDFRFRPYDGTDEGTWGNRTGTRTWPPRAYFVPSCTNLSCSFDASGSTARSSAINSYTWRFGDGATGSSVNPSHDFSTNGTYYVTLTVTDLNGKRDNYTAKVRVSQDEIVNELPNIPPVAALSVTCDGLTCDFDSSSSTDSDGTITNYSWTFGDGSSSSSANPSHTFDAAGTYIARLVVTDDDGDKDMTFDEIVVETFDMGSEEVDPNVPPTSAFSYTCDGLECSFDSSDSSDSDGSIDSYLWQFGDKNGSTTASPTHTYPSAGTYRVQLEVTDDGGLSESSFERLTVKISGGPLTPDQPPTAAFTYTCDALACSFDASGSSDSDGTIESYIWSYGDGQKRSDLGATPSHTFSLGGTKVVTLVVIDDAGNKDVTYQQFEVVSDDFTDVDNGGGFLIDEVPPTAPTLEKSGTTHQTLDLGLNSISDSDLFKREVWISEVEDNTNDRNIAGDGGALRWDEGYDPNLLSKSTTATTVDNLEEWTEYYVRVWARDVYGNESNNGAAVRMRTNDRADASDGSESKATNGTGEVTIGSTFGDRDDTETAYATYEYNVGAGWRPMSIGSVASATDGSPAIDGNQVGTADAYIPVDEGDNDVSVVWNSKDDLPDIDISNAQIRVIPNDTIESGEALIMQDIILDNVAPSGFGGGAATHTASVQPRQLDPNAGLMAKLNFHARTAFASVLGRAATETATVTWTPVTSESNWYGIAAYWVKYGTSSDALTSTWDSGNDSALTTMSTSSTDITGLLEDTTYYFQVYVQDAFGNQSSTSVFSVSTSSGGEVVVAGGGGGGFVGEVPSAVLAQNEEDFVFEYELPDHWSAEYIEDLLERDYVLELIAEDERVLEFMELLLENPNHNVTREESLFLMAIVRGELPDENFIPEEQSAFSDVTDDNPLYDVILQSYENGEVEGHPDGSFKPKGSTKRVEALKFIMELLEVDVKDEAASFRASLIFPDVQGGVWYSPYLDYALENEVVNGYTDGTFRPSDTVTLAEMLKMALLTQ